MTLAPSRGRVLVVEDDDVTRDLFAEILESEGYEVAAEPEGRAALVRTRSWRPDLIILDLVMPGVDGWYFRALQRQIPRLRDVPVIVISARRPPWREEDMLEPTAFLAKPFDLDAFVSLVDRTIKAERAASEPTESHFEVAGPR